MIHRSRERSTAGSLSGQYRDLSLDMLSRSASVYIRRRCRSLYVHEIGCVHIADRWIEDQGSILRFFAIVKIVVDVQAWRRVCPVNLDIDTCVSWIVERETIEVISVFVKTCNKVGSMDNRILMYSTRVFRSEYVLLKFFSRYSIYTWNIGKQKKSFGILIPL